jgi:glycopeptide antibiotics resistance protein
VFESVSEEESTVTGFAALFLKDTSPLVGILLNILLYHPLGYLLPILFPKLKPKHVILIGCLCSIATEATQYILKMGWCETDDVIHNTLGTAIGVWVWLWQSKRLNAQRSANPEKGET